jgi:hypothetical protein
MAEEEKKAAIQKTAAPGSEALAEVGTFEEEALDEEEDLLAEGDGKQFMKLPEGRKVVRILPPPKGKKSPMVVAYVHREEVPDKDEPIMFVCPRVMEHRPCPSCQKMERLAGTGNPKDFEQSKKHKPKRRVYCDAVDRAHEARGPQILAFGPQIHDQLRKLRRDRDAGGNYTDMVNGFDIIITRTGTGKNDTDYDVKAARNTSPMGNPEWLGLRHNLDRYVKALPYDDIVKLLAGESGGGGGDDRPRRGRGDGGERSGRSAQDIVEDDANPFGPPGPPATT